LGTSFKMSTSFIGLLRFLSYSYGVPHLSGHKAKGEYKRSAETIES
jgi:hypothetical protein